jgi:hypothetical protein
MRTRHSRIYLAVTLVSFGIVAGATIAQAIREQSWEPIWSVAWLPYVLIWTLRRPASARACLPRLRRRARS